MTPPPAEQLAARIFIGPALRAQPDRRLVDLVRDGYDAAFEEIVRRYRRPLDRFAAAIVGGRSEDVTQDAFSKALLALRGSEAEIELRPWLYRIVRNTALNDLRDNPAVTEELSETIAGARSAAAEVESREELTDLMERLRALPEPQRAALVMRELEGLSHEEIAAALGVSGGAARQAIYRARATLRNGLGLLLPLPLLRTLAESGGEAAAAGGAVAGAGGSAIFGGLGGGTAAKVGVATVLVAGAAGAGVAVEQRGGNDNRGPEAAQAAPVTPGAQPSTISRGSGSPGSDGGSSDDRSGGSSGGDGDDGRRGEARADTREDRGDAREDRRDDRADQREDRRDDREDRREDELDDREDEADEDRSGSSGSGSSGSGGSGSSGPGSSGSDDGVELDDNSGSGSSSSGSGSSGSGSGGDDLEIEEPEEPEIEEPELDDDSSGSGSGGDDFDDD
jgi:RNA polymerase sigma factor (sigma-70 family)